MKRWGGVWRREEGGPLDPTPFLLLGRSLVVAAFPLWVQFPPGNLSFWVLITLPFPSSLQTWEWSWLPTVVQIWVPSLSPHLLSYFTISVILCIKFPLFLKTWSGLIFLAGP